MTGRDPDPELAFLTHDLNQLLWAIQGRAEALASACPEAAASARAMAEDAAAAAAMLRQQATLRCDPAPVVAAAWRQATDHAAATAAAAGARVPEVRLEGPDPAAPATLAVALPPAALRRILANVLVNARQALGAGGGVVRWSLTGDGDRVRLRVHDSGPGVPPELQARLFEPGVTASKAGGHGLGLAGARALARRHGGELRLADTDAPGACFELEAPRAAAAPGAAAAAPGPGPAAPGAVGDVPPDPLRILVVDDEAAVREMLAEVLAAAGHQTTVVAGAEAALASTPAGRYDAALIDLGLPGPGGAALAARLRAADAALGTVVITGWGRERELADLDPAHVDLTATKPLDLVRLQQLLAEAARLTSGRRGGTLPEG